MYLFFPARFNVQDLHVTKARKLSVAYQYAMLAGNNLAMDSNGVFPWNVTSYYIHTHMATNSCNSMCSLLLAKDSPLSQYMLVTVRRCLPAPVAEASDSEKRGLGGQRKYLTISHMLHVWHIYQHWLQKSPKCS